MKNVNHQLKKDFKSAELLTKTCSFLLKTILKREEVKSICVGVTKHAAKKVAKAEVNWLWTID